MTMLKTWGLAALLSLTSLNALAQTATYSFLAAGQIKLCPGITPRVLKAEVVNSIQSGGCCGRRFEWHEGDRVIYPGIVVEVIPRAGPHFEGRPGITIIPPLRLREWTEGRLRAFDLSKLAYGETFVQALDPALPTLERFGIDQAAISVCISRFDIVNIVQHLEAPTNVTFNLGYRVYAITGPSEKRVTRLVQELGGLFTIQSKFYFLISGNDLQAKLILENSWGSIQERFGELVQPVPNAEAERGLQFVHGLLSDFTNSMGH